MRNYCTLGDQRYLPQLVCLIDSIVENFKHEYKIHVLCLDDKVFNFLKKKYDINLYHIDQIQEDFSIKALRYLPAGQEAISNALSSSKDPQFVQFCWSLAPCFTDWIMQRVRQSCTYVDADLFFFNDTQQFFNELGKKSIGLVRHRIDYIYTSGEFNVGVVHFENDGPGRSALKFWCDVMKNPRNQYSLGYGTCGDQKYLEAINTIYGDHVAIIDKNFGHLAPWNVTFHKYKNDKVIWNDIQQDLVYFHFAHFVVEENGYRGSYKNEWIWGDPVNHDPYVKKLYDLYYRKMIEAAKESL